jgi:hypothetical protein
MPLWYRPYLYINKMFPTWKQNVSRAREVRPTSSAPFSERNVVFRKNFSHCQAITSGGPIICRRYAACSANVGMSQKRACPRGNLSRSSMYTKYTHENRKNHKPCGKTCFWRCFCCQLVSADNEILGDAKRRDAEIGYQTDTNWKEPHFLKHCISIYTTSV